MAEQWAARLRAFAEKDGRGYPDWALRYTPIVKRLGRRNLAAERVLEIGANENGFARFADVAVIAVDRSVDHLRVARARQRVLPVAADITALPFPDRSVDVAVCVDTFEHLPASDREHAVLELVRVLSVSGSGAVAFPAGERAAAAEQTIREAYAAFTGRTLGWLEEHKETGLPDAARLADRFAAATAATHVVTHSRNAPIWIWKTMWRILMCGWPGRGNAVFQALLRLATPVLCRLRIGACYRTIIWLEPRRK